MAMNKVSSALIRLAIAALGILALPPGSANGAARTPVVLFSGYTLNKVVVTVKHQVVASDCPRSGTFEDWFQNTAPSIRFSQVCRDKLLTLRYDPDPRKPMPRRFSIQRGVTVRIPDYGKTESAPLYEPRVRALEAAGYVRDTTSASLGTTRGSRRTWAASSRARSADPGDLPRQRKPARTPRRAFERADLRPVPVDAHLGRAGGHRYIQGFTPLAGNFPGQGVLYPVLFAGLNIQVFAFPRTTENAGSSARMYLSQPASYLSAADPRVFGRREVVVRDASSGRSYTRATTSDC